jgi:AraC-like DNA-binding protein
MEPVRVRTKENWHVFGTKFSPSTLHRELSHLLGREALQSIEFEPIVRFDRGAGLLVKRMLARLYEASALSEFELPTSGIQIRQTELSLITLVLEGLNHNYSKFVNGPERKIAPWQVRSVEEFISQNADRPLSLGDLSVVSGASARSLQYTFLRHRGCSPMEFLRRTRFERAHGELLSGSDGATVTSTALRWGFSHLSRFSAEYRRRFNESPSDTLRRARGVSRQAASAGF